MPKRHPGPKRLSAQRPIRWLMVVANTGGASSTLRVHIWRRLRGLGALYLQQSVALLPDEEAPRRAVHRLADRAHREGGELRVLPITIADRAAERTVVEELGRERADEYAEVCARAPAFLEEIASERAKGRATYTEVEESEADLHRLEAWLAKIQARDYFGADGASEAIAAVEKCAETLADFEREALSAEIGEDTSHEATGPRGRSTSQR